MLTNIFLQEIISHPYYSKIRRENDIALLRLENQIDFTKSTWIQPVCLETDVNDVDSIIPLTGIGWGIDHIIALLILS